MPGNAVYRTVVGVSNPATAQLIDLDLESSERFTRVGVASNAVLALELVQRLQPDVLILTDSGPGIRGRELVPEMLEAVPELVIILLVDGAHDLYAPVEGVNFLAPDGDLDEIDEALTHALHLLDSPRSRGSQASDRPNRRTGLERRLRQDWAKVFAERRTNERRKTSDRSPQTEPSEPSDTAGTIDEPTQRDLLAAMALAQSDATAGGR